MDMRVVNCEQGSQEWLAARLGKVSASRVKDVLAKGRGAKDSTTRDAYMCQLIAERLTGRLTESYSNDDMARGTQYEPVARSLYQAHSGFFVDQVGFVLHPSIEWSGASPDGLVDDDGAGGLLEIKCPRTHNHIATMESGQPPTQYMPQMAWQCACTGRTWVDFVSFDPTLPKEYQLFVARYTPEAHYIAELEGEVQKFLAQLEARLEALKNRESDNLMQLLKASIKQPRAALA